MSAELTVFIQNLNMNNVQCALADGPDEDILLRTSQSHPLVAAPQSNICYTHTHQLLMYAKLNTLSSFVVLAKPR